MNESEKYNILVVDDSEKIRKLVTTILSSYAITTAENGAQALDKFYNAKFDLVMLDLAMPVMDGYDTLQRILDDNPETKVLILSAMDNEPLKQKCIDLGAIGYISKPFSRQELLTTIENSFSKNIPKHLITFANDLTKTLHSTYSDLFDQKVIVTLNSTELIKPNPDDIIIDYPGLSEGYVTECKNNPAKVIAFIDIAKRATLSKFYDDIDEFFNVTNCKIVSKLTNFMKTDLQTKQIRLFSKEKDQHANEALKLDFSLNIGDNTIPLVCFIKLS